MAKAKKAGKKAPKPDFKKYIISNEEIGLRIQLIRKHLGMTQKELADVTSTNQNIVSRLENGEGGTIQYLFTVLGFFKSRDVYVKNFLEDDFDVATTDNPHSNKEQISDMMKEMKNHLDYVLDRVDLLLDST